MKKYILIACATLAISVYSYIDLSNIKTTAVEVPPAESHIVETTSGRLIKITDPRDLKDLVSHSALITKGKIINIENVQEEIPLIEGTPERAATEAQGGKATHTRTGTNYTISVSEVLKGQLDNQEIIMYISEDEIGLRPELKIGDELIFNLYFNKTIGKYIDVHPRAAYLRVNVDKKVKPMFDKIKEFKELENESYDEVKKKIKDVE
ncbi:hypothetical protein M3194_05220 [Paenibacillus glycanilyticus]|uniref:hypothetical protein n=1 Tax=Paenibacillus glycanilyticus TaxID=126569 RepID=UPI00203B7ABF|nr:hypothetical protein [Paenibacillus glycanilyticus]MCM3626759.1 hypothetical protein [Paenibacillus glycanilyticus]